MEGQRAVHALDAEQRNALAAQGATLLLLGVPPLPAASSAAGDGRVGGSGGTGSAPLPDGLAAFFVFDHFAE
eukprot:COSAG06_NODE_34130_length_479_cov_0.786842_2_plen_71_part_01